MSINPMLSTVIVLLFVIIYSSYSARSLKEKILCSFTRKDRTRILKWAKVNQGRIDFDGGWYDVEPSRTVQRLWESGIHFIIPTWVRCSDYRFDSSRPLNPDTFENQYSPELRKQLDISDGVKGLEQGNREALISNKSGRQNILQQYLPIIVLGGFVIIGWFLWQQQGKTDDVGFAINVVQQQLADLLKNR